MTPTTPRPTPETDAEVGYFDLETAVSADFARKLERERDEAREWQNVKVTKNGETHCLGTLIDLLERERDEARALNGDMLKLMRRLHLAITARMSADNPTDEQRLELRLAWEEAGKFLEGFMPLTQPMNTITTTP